MRPGAGLTFSNPCLIAVKSIPNANAAAVAAIAFITLCLPASANVIGISPLGVLMSKASF